jgi:hypothetical protein
MSKMIIIENCMECSHHKWFEGKPWCKHPQMQAKYPRCPTDGTRDFLEMCPLVDYVDNGV